MQKEIRLLRANEIDVRVGQVTKDKTSGQVKGVTLLLYKDARVDMDMLDEVFGTENWQRKHDEKKGVMYCGVSVNFGTTEAPCWVEKWDAGTESNTEAQKGEASDSFKRACVNFGIGRELYTAPFIYMQGDVRFHKYRVTHIAYNDNREIMMLEIVDLTQNTIAFQYGYIEANKVFAITRYLKGNEKALQYAIKQAGVDKLEAITKETLVQMFDFFKSKGKI